MYDSGYMEFDTYEERETLISDFFQLLSQIVEKMRNILNEIKSLVLSPKRQASDEGARKRKLEKDDLNTQSPILKEILSKPIVNSLDDVAGIHHIKKILYALVILPRQQPQLFENRSVNSILLFGPPGTGKTRLVHAVAAQSGAHLYSISLGDIMSSFLGQTERNIQNIFESLCNSEDFNILFIDELDGICRKRTSSEQEYSRRIKTQLMCQLTNASQCKNLIVMAATNTPWELDSAILRRFQKRLYIPLPNKEERLQLFQLFTNNFPVINNDSESLEHLIEISDGFSGSDIFTLVNDALDIPITELQDNKIWIKGAGGLYEPYSQECQIDDILIQDLREFKEDILILDLREFPSRSIKARTVSILDFLKAAENIQPTVQRDEIRRYEEFIGRLKTC